MEQLDSYHVFSKIIHWVTALLILGLLFIGFYMNSLAFSEDKLSLYGWHKSFGLLVLILAGVRVVWHIVKPKPKPLSTHKKWEHGIARFAHVFLYLALFIMPISGWVMSSAGDFTVKFFGFDVPDLTQKNEALFQNSRQIHEILAYTLLLIVGLHMVGALKHHFIDRDRTLRRMTVPDLGIIGGAIMSILVILLYACGGIYAVKHLKKQYLTIASVVDSNVRASVDEENEGIFISSVLPEWHIDIEDSLIGFEATQYGQGFEGSFKIARGQIFFDEARLGQSKLRIEIDISSVKTGSNDRDEQAISTEWFDVKAFPYAIFESHKFEKMSANHFLASGKLTLRGITVPIALLFILNIDEGDNGENVAHMTAKLDLNRLDFGIGQGKWQNTDAIGAVVKLNISVVARTK
ncbi:MAG: cytochrome B [Alphaproteobacteria bacterium]|nr:MAG: cytochrome B [Alphaproteobacteria bacterium]